MGWAHAFFSTGDACPYNPNWSTITLDCFTPMSTYVLRPLPARERTLTQLVLQSLPGPCGNYDTGIAGEWLWKGRGGRRFLADGGVGLYVAPVAGKGYGLFTVGAHDVGTAIAYVQGHTIPSPETRQAGTYYVNIRKAGAVFVCDFPTIEEPACFANTATTRIENNARFVVNPRTHAVRVELTRAVGAFEEILVDYGEECRTELRQLTRAQKRQRADRRTDSVDSEYDYTVARGAEEARRGPYEAVSAADAIAVWRATPTTRIRCPACHKKFYRGKGRAHVLNCRARPASNALESSSASITLQSSSAITTS